jgi:hypothetical protein
MLHISARTCEEIACDAAPFLPIDPEKPVPRSRRNSMSRRAAIFAASAAFVLIGGTGTAFALASTSSSDDPAPVENPTVTTAPDLGTFTPPASSTPEPTEAPEATEPTEPPEATEPTFPPTTATTEPEDSTERGDDSASTTPESEHDTESEHTAPPSTAPTSGTETHSGAGEHD